MEESKVLQSCPWERKEFKVPPRGADKWIIGDDAQWICRTHSKAKKRGFHPLHRSVPLSDPASLSKQRVTIVFHELNDGSSPCAPLIFVDQYTDVQSELQDQKSHWKGYTFFFRAHMDKDGNILKAKTQTASEATSPVSEPQVSKEAVSAHVPTESDGEFELVEVPN